MNNVPTYIDKQMLLLLCAQTSYTKESIYNGHRNLSILHTHIRIHIMEVQLLRQICCEMQMRKLIIGRSKILCGCIESQT